MIQLSAAINLLFIKSSYTLINITKLRLPLAVNKVKAF